MVRLFLVVLWVSLGLAVRYFTLFFGLNAVFFGVATVTLFFGVAWYGFLWGYYAIPWGFYGFLWGPGSCLCSIHKDTHECHECRFMEQTETLLQGNRARERERDKEGGTTREKEGGGRGRGPHHPQHIDKLYNIYDHICFLPLPLDKMPLVLIENLLLYRLLTKQ